MLFKRRIEEPVAATPIPVPVGQKITRTSIGGVELVEYVAVAEKISFSNGALLAAKLQEFLSKKGLLIYDYAKVSEFLTAKVKAEGRKGAEEERVWCWKPLRAADAGKLQSGMFNENGHISRTQYHGAVPYPVLLTVQQIEEAFGDQVHFYVSDYASRVPDPFLAITGLGIAWFVVEHWDEPDFRA